MPPNLELLCPTPFLFGVYTGVIFPDAAADTAPERTTALGAVCPMNLLTLHLKLARAPTYC